MMSFEGRGKEWKEGYTDYHSGISILACPYKDEVKADAWYEGWSIARGYEYLHEDSSKNKW